MINKKIIFKSHITGMTVKNFDCLSEDKLYHFYKDDKNKILKKMKLSEAEKTIYMEDLISIYSVAFDYKNLKKVYKHG